MVDSVLLLVDAAEGPLPQTRYVLQKAMARRLPVVVAINKIDRARRARRPRSLDAVYELFMDLGADEHQIEFPVVYTNAKAGHGDAATSPCPARTCGRCSICSSTSRRRRRYTPGHPLQLLVTNLSANDYVGRMAVGRIWNGTIRMGQRITVIREEADDTAGSVEPGRDGHADRHGHEPHHRAWDRARRHRGGRAGRHRGGRRPARRSRSATRSPIPPTRGRCRASTSTSRR